MTTNYDDYDDDYDDDDDAVSVTYVTAVSPFVCSGRSRKKRETNVFFVVVPVVGVLQSHSAVRVDMCNPTDPG